MKVYQMITDKICGMLADGVVPWKRPWRVEWPVNFKTKKRYRGINVFILQMAGFNSPYWLTFKQVSDLGGKVRKDEKATLITFWKLLEATGDEAEPGDEEGNEKDGKKIPLLRYYYVFNLEQTEGIEYPKSIERTDLENIDAAEKIVEEMPQKPEIKFGGDRAFYRPSADLVQVPELGRYDNPAEYYSTLFHELTHSTGHPKRLNRKNDQLGAVAFGSEEYSKEELIAEMGAAFLCGVVGIENAAALTNSAAYIQSWLKQLKDDPRLVVTAAAQAQKAADFILGINPVSGS